MIVDEIIADVHIRSLPHILDVLGKATNLKTGDIMTFNLEILFVPLFHYLSQISGC